MITLNKLYKNKDQYKKNPIALPLSVLFAST